MLSENGSSSPTLESSASIQSKDVSISQNSQHFPVNTRLWRPAAQRNLKNKWLKLASLRHDWTTSSATARSHATALVNSYLSQTCMEAMDLGALSDMPGIRHKACLKLLKQQELQRKSLLKSYKDMVRIVADMANVSRSMRCYTKGSSSSPVTQFSCFSDNENDTGDGGGIGVFKFLSISEFEAAAENYVQMFVSELNLKRLLVMELSSMGDNDEKSYNSLHWSNEFYPGEFEDLSSCNLYNEEASEPFHPSNSILKSDVHPVNPRHQLDRDVLQVYLTTWISEVNIAQSRVEEIIDAIGCEIQVTLN